MAARCVLGKLGKSSKCNFQTSAINYSQKIALPFDFRGHENRIPIPKATKNKLYDYHMEIGGVGPARFATQEFNKRKNTQLQFVRVLRAFWVSNNPKIYSYPGRFYHLELEAIDDGALKLYYASVLIESHQDVTWLEKFYLLVDNEYPLKLYHHLDNFYDD